MAQERLNRDEFYDLLAGMNDAALKKALWTLYWRGGGQVRERVVGALGVSTPRTADPAQPDPDAVLQDVNEFAALARAGAYLAGDRRVSPKARSRWRFTFRDLVGRCLQALRSEDEESVRAGASALTVMIDLALEMGRIDYFRSEDPVEAARFVVSDAVRALWLRTRAVYGPSEFTQRACAQLLRWESRHGWTRRGDGWVAARETSLAQVAAELLTTPDMWNEFAEVYIAALAGRRSQEGRRASSYDLGEWHALLSERLIGSEYEGILDRVGRPPEADRISPVLGPRP
ncbi:MAG TPA: hypothetical protein PLT68_04335 [Actinomycetota bacterium]|nr:hypothetical protein [Actinomycetota bacterium]